MAKKANKVSWRTLARRAKKAADKGHKAAATRLSNMAAEARKTERKVYRVKKGKLVPVRNLGAAKRAVKGWATRHANALKREVAAVRDPVGAALYGDRVTIKDLAREAHKAGLAVQISSIPKTEQGLNAEYRPGHGELVGGADAQTAERIVKLARKKGGTDAVQNEIKCLQGSARYEGQKEADRRATERLIQVQQIIADRVVCGFIAEVDARQRNGLAPQDTFTLNSFTIVKIVDALNKAGYKGTGKS